MAKVESECLLFYRQRLLRTIKSSGFHSGASLDPDETGLALDFIFEFYIFEKVVDGPGSDLDL